MNETGDSVQCVTEYGRTYYLTVQFTFLAFLVGMQVGGFGLLRAWGRDAWGGAHARAWRGAGEQDAVETAASRVQCHAPCTPLCTPCTSPMLPLPHHSRQRPQVFGSVLFIMMYYWRRISWRLRNRKGKQRIARAARDALALKKKNSDTFDIQATASAGTSITDRVRWGVWEWGARVGGWDVQGFPLSACTRTVHPVLLRQPGCCCPVPLLQLGAGVDPEWLAQHTARTSGSGGSDLSGSDLGSDDYSPRSSDASPSARRWAGAAASLGVGRVCSCYSVSLLHIYWASAYMPTPSASHPSLCRSIQRSGSRRISL